MAPNFPPGENPFLEKILFFESILIFEPETDQQAAGEPGLTESKGLKLDGLPLLDGLRTGAQVVIVFVFVLFEFGQSTVIMVFKYIMINTIFRCGPVCCWTCTLQLTLMMGEHSWLIGKETIRWSEDENLDEGYDDSDADESYEKDINYRYTVTFF